MNIINNLQSWLQEFREDPKFRAKIIFFIGASLVSVIVISLIYWLNFSPKNSQVTVTDTATTSRTVNTVDFESSKGIEKADDQKVGLPSQVYFAPGGNAVFFDSDLKLRVNGQTVPDSPSFATRQVFFSGSSIILNEDFRSTLWTPNGGFKVYPTGDFQVTPVLFPDSIGLRSINGFLFISTGPDGYTIKQADDINLTKNVQVVARVQPKQTLQSVEIRILNNVPYVVLYETIARQGDAEMYRVDGNTLKQVQSFQKIQSIQFGSKQLLITSLLDTPTDLTIYKNTLVDFSSSSDGVSNDLDLASHLGQSSIFGSILADRCVFGLQNTLDCLVKYRKVSKDAIEEADAIAQFDFIQKKLDLPYSGLNLSGENLALANNGQLYMIGQSNGFLYRLK